MEPHHEINRHRRTKPDWEKTIALEFLGGEASRVHESLAEFTPTPLVSLPKLAKQLGVGQVLVKDESHRFGLNAFKALGSTYAVYHVIKKHLEVSSRVCPVPDQFYREMKLPRGTFTFCTATDGNHGRAVAHMAALLGFDALQEALKKSAGEATH